IFHHLITTSISFFFYCYLDHHDLHSFPTRRSSDLLAGVNLSRGSLRGAKLIGCRLTGAILIGSDMTGVTISAADASDLTAPTARSEEHTSELQSRGHLVCRLLLEKKKTKKTQKNQ